LATDISEIINLVRPDVLSVPQPIINREVVSIILEFCKKTSILQREFELEIDSGDLDDDRQDCIDFNISAWANAMRPTVVMDILIDSVRYVPHKRNILNTITAFNQIPGAAGTSISSDERFKYYWVPNNQTIRIFDMTSSMSTLYLRIAVKPLRAATTIDTDLFEDWSEAFVAGAKYKLLSMPGKDWTDKKSAEDFKRDWRKYLSQAKQHVLSGGTDIHQENIKWKSFGEI